MKILRIAYNVKGFLLIDTTEGLDYLDGTKGVNTEVEPLRRQATPPPAPKAPPAVKPYVKAPVAGEEPSGVEVVNYCPKCRPEFRVPGMTPKKQYVCSNCGSISASWASQQNPEYLACKGCGGTGKPRHGLTNICIKCGGSGIEPLPCPQCSGFGENFSGSICPKCGGLGVLRVQVPSALGCGDGCSEC